MDLRESIIALINQSLAAQIISQEDLLQICGEDSSTLRSYTQNQQAQKAVDYLNSVTATSDNNFRNVMRQRGVKLKAVATLKKCLRLRKFKFTQKRGTRVYYVKSGSCPDVEIEDIIL